MKQLKLHRTSLQSPSPTVTVSTQLNTEPSSVPLAWLPDTGSDVDAIGLADLYKLGGYPENLDDDDDDVRTADGTRLRAIGSIFTQLSANGRNHDTVVHVYDGLHDALLSRQSLQALGFLPDNWPHSLQVARIDLPERDPTPAEINKIRADLVSEFADVFSESTDKLKPMAGPDMDIVLEPDAKPRRVYTARPIPYAYREQIKQQLDDMVAEGIIEPVTEPTDWCHPIVVVDKKNSSEKRLTVDLKSLNSQVKRPAHSMATPRDLLPNIGTSKWFTKVDARHGYWQIPLSDAAKPLTTFITPWGRFQYLRNPQGLISAGDGYNRRTDAAFAHLNNFVKVVDDGLVPDRRSGSM